jgi:hypothetical protein
MERWRRQLVVWEKIALDETTEPEPHGPAPDPE